jgi:hypothetical protein
VRAGLSRNLELWGLGTSSFAGVEVRGVLVGNAKKAIVREYLFANSQWYISPAVGTTATLPLWGPLSAVAQLGIQPVFSVLEDKIALADGVASAEAGSLQQLPMMFGATGELGLEAAIEHWTMRLSYKYETFRPLSGEFQTLQSGGLTVGYRY